MRDIVEDVLTLNEKPHAGDLPGIMRALGGHDDNPVISLGSFLPDQSKISRRDVYGFDPAKIRLSREEYRPRDVVV